MRKIMTGIGLAMLMSAVAAQATLLMQYEFNNTNTSTTVATDSSGNGNNGTLQNSTGVATALQTGIGVSGQAGDYAFNGTAASSMGGTGGRTLYTGSGLNSSYASVTVCGWFKTAGTEALASSTTTRLFQSAGTGADPLGMGTYGAASGFGMQIATTNAVYLPSNPYTNTEQWVFFAMTYNSTIADGLHDVFFYIGSTNGAVTLAGSGEMNPAAGTWGGAGNPASLVWGNRHTTGFTDAFDGYMDDLRLYGSTNNATGALSLAELDVVRLAAIPEPATISLFGMALGAILLMRRRG